MRNLKIHFDKNGIRVEGARDIGSCGDTDANSKRDFMRVCEHWWNTYCEGFKGYKAKEEK